METKSNAPKTIRPPSTLEIVNNMNGNERKVLLAFLIASMRGNVEFDRLLKEGVEYASGTKAA